MLNKPLPVLRTSLAFDATFDENESALLRQGLRPQSMDDKWAATFVEGWLYVSRSWTGFTIFGVELLEDFLSTRVGHCWVSRDPEQYNSTDTAEDLARLRRVLDLITAPQQ